MTERCIPCEQSESLQFRNVEREKLIQRLNEIYKDENEITTLAIIRTKNGFLGFRHPGDESLRRLKIVEFISKLPGAAFE